MLRVWAAAGSVTRVCARATTVGEADEHDECDECCECGECAE